MLFINYFGSMVERGETLSKDNNLYLFMVHTILQKNYYIYLVS